MLLLAAELEHEHGLFTDKILTLCLENLFDSCYARSFLVVLVTKML